MEVKIDEPIFIVGVGRSGTTLIQSMLNAHQEIAFTPETHFIRNFIANIKVNKKLKQGDINWVRKKIINDKSLKRLEFDLNNIVDSLLNNNNFTLINFYKKLLLNYANNKSKPIIGDKDPKNIEHLYDIKKIFPNSYIIHIIRDPRDVMLSRMKAEWSKGRNLITHALIYREQLNKGRRDGKEIFNTRYYELFYEDLIEFPEESLKNICEFLQIDYDSNMMNFNTKANEIIKGEEKKWKDNCFKSVISSNKNKWKDQLSKEKVSLVESICQTPFESLDYIESGYINEIKFIEEKYYKLLGLISYFFDVAYNLYHKFKDFRSSKYINKQKAYGR